MQRRQNIVLQVPQWFFFKVYKFGLISGFTKAQLDVHAAVNFKLGIVVKTVKFVFSVIWQNIIFWYIVCII
jgi:hypothetical protein